VGLVVGDPGAPVRRLSLAVDCVQETVAAAIDDGADMMIVHHPLLLRGVHSVATTSYKGSIVTRLIRAGTALYVAHTNADVASPGVSDALAAALGLTDVAEMVPGRRHPGRVGQVPGGELTLATLAEHVAARLPRTAGGVRAAGDPDRPVRRLGLCGGAGDEFLDDATAAGVDAYLCADLRHHKVSEHLADGGPVLLDAAHWATERPWLDVLAAELVHDLGVEVRVCDLVTDAWTVRADSASGAHPQEEQP
jgi:dinuclear metal center YbgI/SA1388 family protein